MDSTEIIEQIYFNIEIYDKDYMAIVQTKQCFLFISPPIPYSQKVPSFLTMNEMLIYSLVALAS